MGTNKQLPLPDTYHAARRTAQVILLSDSVPVGQAPNALGAWNKPRTPVPSIARQADGASVSRYPVQRMARLRLLALCIIEALTDDSPDLDDDLVNIVHEVAQFAGGNAPSAETLSRFEVYLSSLTVINQIEAKA